VNGIGGTRIKPGFIKIGVDKGKLTPVNRKLIEAAARCHLKTGLTIASHTGDGVAAMDQLDVLRKEGVSPSAWIWVHAQNEAAVAFQKKTANAGAWIELDGLQNNEESIKKHVALVKILRDAGSLERVLLSHDAGWYTVGQIRGGEVRGYTTLFKQFVPALKDAGFEDADITRLTVINPAKAFAVGIRKA
jgi:phosphotriesterase-related protein